MHGMLSCLSRPGYKLSHSTYSVALITVCLLVFYAVYGVGPFKDMDNKQKLWQQKKKLEIQEDRSRTVNISWAEGGPEHGFWPEDPVCNKMVTRFAKVTCH